ncbi:MAG TPA: cupredoxin domain-containing protein [Alphaproteobacteria bacterium]
MRIGFTTSLALIAAVAAAVAYSTAAPRAATERVVQLTASRFTYAPDKVTLKVGEPVVLELRTSDRKHGFKLPAFDVRADVEPDQVVQVRIVPDKVGTFSFACDQFCGSGHEEMDGTIVVTE